MAILTFPIIQNSFFYVERIGLQGSTYDFTFRFNSRMQTWMLDISDPSGNLILRGIPIRESYPLTDRFINRVLGLPPGLLICIDTTLLDREPGADLLGSDCQMFYVER